MSYKIRTSWTPILCCLFLLGCSGETPPPARNLEAGEGFVEVEGGKVWYRIAGSGSATPVLLLHGGPGATSYYLEPLELLADERPVVFYDQLGCGRSDRPGDPALWTVEHYMKELQQVRDALGLAEIHLYGHSWGAMLAAEYLLTEPAGVKSVVMASPAFSVPRFIEDANALRAELPEATQEVLDRHEADGTTDSDEYMAATMEFYRRHVCRLDPWPLQMDQTMENFGWDVYHFMWGPTEFFATGTLKDFDVTGRLGELDLPMLLTAGRYDEVTPETTAWYQSLIPGASLEVFEEASHLTMLEVPDEYARVLSDFFRRVEGDGP